MGVREVFGERYRSFLVFAEAKFSAFANVSLVDWVERYEIRGVAYLVVIRVLHGVKRDAVTPFYGADRHPSDGGLAIDLGTPRNCSIPFPRRRAPMATCRVR